MTSKTMDQSYLIQRLQKPFKPTGSKLDGLVNAFSFGGGLRNGGLSDKAMELIKDIWRFDYMGSSEFEWGAVPEALSKIAKNVGDYVAAEIQVDAQESKLAAARHKAKKQSQQTGKATIYILCPLDWVDEVTKRISGWAIAEPYGETKEGIYLQRAIFPDSEFAKEYAGWLELDNGFFFFTDKEMYEKTRQLFGIIELSGVK